MALTPRQKLKAVTPTIKRLGSKRRREAGRVGSNKGSSNRTANWGKIAKNLVQVLDKVFERFQLKRDDPDHRLWLLYWLAWSIYGGKSPGRGKKWLKKSHRLLLTDIENLRRNMPGLSEDQLCRELCKGKSKLARYESLKPSTLRRQLQNAKLLHQRDLKENRRAKPLEKLLSEF